MKYSNQEKTNINVTTTNETIAVTLAGVSSQRAGQKMLVDGFIQITTGANTTGLTIRVRRGATIADLVVGEANIEQVETAAGNTEGHTVSFEDTPGEVGNQTYVLTVQAAGATADATILYGKLTIEPHP